MDTIGKVGTVLHRKPSEIWSIAPEATVFDAVQLMANKNIGALLVMDASGALMGILSERDYTRKVILKGRSSKATSVRDIMETHLITVSPHETITDCLRIITEQRIRHLPVMNDGKLVGIVSIGDLVNWIIAAQEMTIDHLQKYITGEYPA